MLLVLIISIGEVNKNIIKLYLEFNSKLIDVQETITNVHPGHKYKKVYQSQRYETNIK